ncbi:LysR substrate-binding domain-containing protein [Vibrio fluvialis]|uniref:LysR substrate-binding domain-containing protein n=1 Tax=Vibrio fluvialis TaxID=676 RepID=UPI0012AD3A20|nr:LysR substrate-binding domain-containing protein [Vibrio fluvialis]EKO3381750.1 LysR family transcriptional regulator [Vibrio fluvialis]EKO3389063.1 LysR family transcriptional regulator [Vibrio fluvialis]EKO3956178.1 LysR family transcriptional regulator [Vibrio fluvialis]EKO3987065.1 LysR family transcriptional regulator [Vibrio fluvialis]ELE8119770.1 LysR family transcriptional regulator [Vibrio fluvialis]
MSERIPPFQGLFYFYTAAETGSFKVAAEKLFVTPAAISQQIRLLEEWLGAELFVRQHRKIHLTHEGSVLYQQAQKGFAHLQEGIRLINQDPSPHQLSISTLPSFAQHWLVPRIGDFRTQHPEISLLIEPTSDLVNFQDSSVDVCIRYGRGDYKNVHSEWLMDEVLYPVCHPIYQQQHNIYQLDDLVRADLIEDIWPDMDWGLWLRNLGYHSSKSTLQYNGSQFVLEGALAVQGVALVKHATACRYIEEGKLVQVGNVALKPRFQFYLCAPSGYFKRPKIQAFHTWLKEEIAQFQQRYPYTGEIRETQFEL